MHDNSTRKNLPIEGLLAGDLAASALPFDAFKQRVRIALQQITEFEELDDIDAAVAMFHFRYERLRASQLFCQLVLRKASLIPRLDQQGEKRLVGSFVD